MSPKLSIKQLYSYLPDDGDIAESENLGDPKESNGLLSDTRRMSSSKRWSSRVTSMIIVCLAVVVLIQSVFIIRNRGSQPLLTPTLFDGLSRERTVERTTYLPSVYWSENETEADLAWEFISAGFGIVAVKAEYAKEQNLPDSETWREDSSKRVYVLEAYHAIHCLRRLRVHYLALLHGTGWGWPVEHDMHCLDGLREYVMCNPDDTLLWTTGHGDVGHGQKKTCQDWDTLRDWAAERTISYFDYERDFEDRTKGVYHSGDGLPVGSF